MNFFFLFILIFLSFPMVTSAKERFEVSSLQNRLELSGECTLDVELRLTPQSSPDTSVYSAMARCKKEKFSFIDNLTQWGLKEGDYVLWVNGEPYEEKINIKKPVVHPSIPSQKSQSKENETPRDIFGEALDNFGRGLGTLHQSLDRIEETMKETEYESNLRRTLLSLIRIAVGTLDESFASFLSAKTETEENILEEPQEVLPENPISSNEELSEESEELSSLEKVNEEEAIILTEVEGEEERKEEVTQEEVVSTTNE